MESSNEDQKFLQWLVTFRCPLEIWNVHPSFVICELLFYFCGISTLIHALRRGGQYPYIWISTLFHGVVVEAIAYYFPQIDNFWHAQGMIMFLGQRLPLYVVFLYPTFLYVAYVAVSHAQLPMCAKPFAVGLAVVIRDLPYDIIGIKYLWWTWHDTDPNIYERHYWVPWNSYYFHASFAWAFTVWTYIFRHVVFRIKKDEVAGCFKELLCCIFVGLLSMPLGCIQFIMLYHPLHDIYNVPNEICVWALFAFYLLIVWSADRKPKNGAKVVARKKWWKDILIIQILLWYITYPLITIFMKPELTKATGIHEPVGPCDEYEPVHTAIGELRKKKYLCTSDYDEQYFDFNCLTDEPHPEYYENWYTICGNEFPNYAEYVVVITTASIVGLWIYLQLFRGSSLPTIPFRKVSTPEKPKTN